MKLSRIAIVAAPLLLVGCQSAPLADAPPVQTREAVLEADLPALQMADSVPPLDRLAWPVVVITPADGRTVHNPTYYGEVPLRTDAVNPARIPDWTRRLDWAVDDPAADNWSARNWVDALWAPVDFGIDSVLIPVRSVTGQWPLAQVTTPSTGE